MFIYGKTRVRALLFVVVGSIGFYGFKGGIFSIIHGGAERVQGPENSFIDGNTFLGLALNMGDGWHGQPTFDGAAAGDGTMGAAGGPGLADGAGGAHAQRYGLHPL